VKKLSSWGSINETLAGFANAMKDQPFAAIAP
jgi:hypothetical protein